MDQEKYPMLTEVLGQAKRSKITIVLDENSESLKLALKAAGFKIISVPKGYSDAQVFDLAETYAVLTRNSKDFVPHAYEYDFDVIDIDHVKFIDTEPTAKNQTVQKIVKAVRESKVATRKGNFHVKIQDDGSFTIEELLI